MLNEIKIKGDKSIKDLSLELKPINILIGANGVGKLMNIQILKILIMAPILHHPFVYRI